MISDPDYCRCGATVRLGLELGTLSIYVPPTSPKHGHRHEWQKERTTFGRHVKDERFTLTINPPQTLDIAAFGRYVRDMARIR